VRTSRALPPTVRCVMPSGWFHCGAHLKGQQPRGAGRALCQHVGVQQHSEAPADAALVADASQRRGVFGRGLKPANSHRSTPSCAFAWLSIPSDTSATGSIPYFWGLSCRGSAYLIPTTIESGPARCST
jgi:hypothetical protein